MDKVRMWKPPARREYSAKPNDPGQRVTWSREISGHWTGHAWGDGSWVAGHTLTRTGIIWSDGPFPRSSWVQPDDAPAGDMALIRYSTPRQARWHGSITETHSFPPSWQHDAIRRAESVRRHGSVYAVVDEVRAVHAGRWLPQGAGEVLGWHADPQCPEAAGKERKHFAGHAPYGLHAVIDILTGRTEQRSSVPFCRRCIYLDQPAPAESLAA